MGANLRSWMLIGDWRNDKVIATLYLVTLLYGFRFDMSSYHFTVRKRLSKQTNVNIYQRVLFLRFITGGVLLSKSLCAYSFHFYGQKLIKIVNKPIHSYVMLVRVHICVYEVIVVYQLLELIKKLMLINHTDILHGKTGLIYV